MGRWRGIGGVWRSVLRAGSSLRPGSAPRRWVLLMPGRTGSSHVIQKLDSHPGIVAKGELFGGDDQPSSPQEVERRLRKLFLRRRPRDVVAVGFKTKLFGTEHPVYEDLDDLERRLGTEIGIDRCIVLLRRNVVKQAVSRIRTEILKRDSLRTSGAKRWNVTREDQRVPPCVIDPDELERWIARYVEDDERLLAFARSIGAPMHVCYYEDMLADENGFFAALLDFLGAPPAALESELIKHTPDDLSAAIANFEEVRERLQGSRYEPMLLEDGPLPSA